MNFFTVSTSYNHYNEIANKIGGSVTMKYVCGVCGYVYDEAAGDPDNGIAPGTKWEDLPEDFVCPLCVVDKSNFSQE